MYYLHPKNMNYLISICGGEDEKGRVVDTEIIFEILSKKNLKILFMKIIKNFIKNYKNIEIPSDIINLLFQFISKNIFFYS